MSVLILLIFVSLMLVLLAVVLFDFSVKNRDLQKSEQISLLPLEDEYHANETNRL